MMTFGATGPMRRVEAPSTTGVPFPPPAADGSSRMECWAGSSVDVTLRQSVSSVWQLELGPWVRGPVNPQRKCTPSLSAHHYLIPS